MVLLKCMVFYFENNISVSASFIRIENERIENSGKAFRDVSLLLKPVDFQVRGGMQNIENYIQSDCADY